MQKGLLGRKVSAADRRARVLQVTDTGHETLRQIWPLVEQAQQIMLAGLSTDESVELMRLLRKATEAGNAFSRAPMRTPSASS